MKFILHPDYEETEFYIPYVCCYSPLVRFAVKHDGRSLKKFIEPALEDIAGNEEIAKSLKQSCTLPGSRSYREIDISAEPGAPVVLKCLIEWQKDKKFWVIFVEGGMENFWEEKWQAMGYG